MSPLAAAELLRFVCPSCAFEFHAEPCAKDGMTCPVCTVARSGDHWQGRVEAISEEDHSSLGDSEVVADR